MKNLFIRTVLSLATLLSSFELYAVGVPAGTNINNTVTVNFQVSGVPGVAFDSNMFQVQEVINVNLVWQDAANVNVTPGAATQVLRFLLTNTGNGSEDFAFMLEHCPGSYLLIGNGDGEGGCMVHNPEYDFNDQNIPIGAAYWVRLAERYLTSE